MDKGKLRRPKKMTEAEQMERARRDHEVIVGKPEPPKRPGLLSEEEYQALYKKPHATDRGILHPRIEEACQEIDAQLFSGYTSNDQLERLEYMCERWRRKILEVRESNDEFEKEQQA